MEKLRIPKNFNAAPQGAANLVSTLLAKIGDRDREPAGARDHAVEDDEIDELRAAHPAAPLPRLRRAGGPRPLGRALLQAAARDRRGCAAGWRAARTSSPAPSTASARCWSSSATCTRSRHRRGPPAGPHLHRARPAHRRVPAQRAVGGARAGELAACVSALVFESRQSEDARRPKIPAGRAQDALTAMTRLWAELEGIESRPRAVPPSASRTWASPGRRSGGPRATAWTPC